MAQNHAHINMMAQQQKELLEQQAAAIQAGTDKVLAAQNAMILAMGTKLKEDDSRVKELLARLTELEMALKREKIRSLEFEKDLLIKRQNKRRAIHSPEEAPGGKARSTSPSQFTDPNSTPGLNNMSSSATPQRACPITGNVLSTSGLPVSRKVNPALVSSVRSKDRQPSQEIIDAMMQPAPIPGIQPSQPVIQQIQPVIQQFQPEIQHIQPAIQQV
jgi:hypothetical protein